MFSHNLLINCQFIYLVPETIRNFIKCDSMWLLNPLKIYFFIIATHPHNFIRWKLHFLRQCLSTQSIKKLVIVMDYGIIYVKYCGMKIDFKIIMENTENNSRSLMKKHSTSWWIFWPRMESGTVQYNFYFLNVKKCGILSYLRKNRVFHIDIATGYHKSLEGFFFHHISFRRLWYF